MNILCTSTMTTRVIPCVDDIYADDTSRHYKCSYAYDKSSWVDQFCLTTISMPMSLHRNSFNGNEKYLCGFLKTYVDDMSSV